MLSRFHLIPKRHGQTDGQTDRQISYVNIARQCTCSRALKTTAWVRSVIDVYMLFCFVPPRPTCQRWLIVHTETAAAYHAVTIDSLRIGKWHTGLLGT